MGNQRRPRRWLWPVVAVLALAGIGAAAVWTGWLSGGHDDPGASPSPSPTAASSRPSGGYDVAAGQGGTALAADGTTPVGYDGTCTGAIQAATNYNTFVVEGMSTERWTPESFQAVLDQIVGFGGDDPYGLRTRLVGEREEARRLLLEEETRQFWQEKTGLLITGLPSIGFLHPERGGYLARSCSAEGQAVVDIVSYWVEPPDGFVVEEDGSVIIGGGPMLHRVSVSWYNGDWRLVEWNKLDLSASPVPYDEPGGLIMDPSAQYRRAWMAASDEPWTEYANAPK
jgi:hypothetical protein